jgi:hypothetical protein
MARGKSADLTSERASDDASLAARFPDLAAQWHPSLNGTRTPASVTAGSKFRAWWRCPECRNTWQAQVHSRTRGHGCPECGRKRAGRAHSTPEEGRSLADLYPDLAAEWHPTRDGTLSPESVGTASNKWVWWQCREGHEWQVQVSNRTQENRTSSCRKCANRTRSALRLGSSVRE